MGDALAALQFLPRRASGTIAKLIKSAAANASAEGGKEKWENLVVKNITVESAGMMKIFVGPKPPAT